jgi:deoxycytidylate deaminase
MSTAPSSAKRATRRRPIQRRRNTKSAFFDAFDDRHPDLFFGLIGPIGCDLDLVGHQVAAQLKRFSYVPTPVKITDLMVRTIPHKRWSEMDRDLPRDEKYSEYMTAGNCLRASMGRNDAMAMLAVRFISSDRLQRAQRVLRARRNSHQPDYGAYVINSLKTPEEVELLRSIYGDRFLAISVHAPMEIRRNRLARLIADSRQQHKAEIYYAKAMELIQRDQQEREDPSGQNVAGAFPRADIFIDGSNSESVHEGLSRAFDLLFDYPYVTPTHHEYAMALAQRASLRSADLSRQIGATIMTGQEHSVLALGTNEVPRSEGGQYWPDELPDDRDFRRGQDTSFKRRRLVLADTIKSLLDAGWVPPGLARNKLPPKPPADASAEVQRKYENRLHALAEKSVKELLDVPSVGREERRLKNRLLIEDIIEFARTVHAEMAALVDCALRGVPTDGATLYTTTFPCHECSRHIVAAGISEVQYIQPYPKSLVEEFHGDSIAFDAPPEHEAAGRRKSGVATTLMKVLFRPFVGIAPRRFESFFAMTVRKVEEGPYAGDLIDWNEGTACPREEVFGISQGSKHVETYCRRAEHDAAIYREEQVAQDFDKQLRELVSRRNVPSCMRNVPR